MTLRQFDVCRVIGADARGGVDLAVVLQGDALSEAATRVVAPLIPLDEKPQINRVTSVVTLDGVRYPVAVHLVTVLGRRNLAQSVGNLRDHERAFKNALDAVFFGV